MAQLITALGPKSMDTSGMILPHEHVFTDLRTCDRPGYGQAEAADVIRLMAPEINKAKEQGITVIVECTPVGVGRRIDILKAVSEATSFPLVVSTGIYREPWIPAWAVEAAEAALREWMTAELCQGIEDTGVKAGWIKLSAGNEGMTACEAKILKAAAGAGADTNAVIGSHTVKGHVLLEQLDVVEKAGYTPERFIWIHAHNEPDFGLHLEAARRGVWIEYDAIGSEKREDRSFIDLILRMLDAGFENRILLSHDRGWYDPAKPGGGSPKPFTYIMEHFLPKLAAAGVHEETIRKLTCTNPFYAFAR